MNKELEMWKFQKVTGLIDCIFDTCFLVFLWLMGWKYVFGGYLFIALTSVIGNASKIKKLEDRII